MKKTLITLAALTLALSACAADTEPEQSNASSQTDAKITTATEDADAPKLDRSKFSTDEVTSDNWLDSGFLQPQTVRTGVHDGYERIVVEYAGEGELGWKTTGWANEAHHPGSGFPVEVGGSRALQIAISGVTYPDAVLNGGSKDEIPDLTATLAKGTQLIGVLVDQPFEGLHNVTLGADSDLKYRITSLTNPTRLVIDLLTD